MSTEWINPKIIIGNKATGDFYYNRQDIVNEIWETINNGSHVLLAAPRRVGKTSVMVYMTENCAENIKCIFENIQSISSENAFYKRFYELILSCLRKDRKIWSQIGDFIQNIKIEEISIEGTVKFGDKTELNFLEEINKILPKLSNIKVILFLDELPEILHRLNKQDKKEEANGILKNLRRWRQEPQFKNLCIVLAGSIGIHHVVKSVDGRTSDINDLYKIKVEALTHTEAVSYISWATAKATVRYSKSLQTYLLQKIQYHLPYFINLMLDEINKTARKKNQLKITNEDIDNAFKKVVKESDHFKDWKSRLFDYFPQDEADFMNETLIYIAHNEQINKRQLYDLARKHSKQTGYMDLVEGLEKDGYITENEDNFIFISPFLKAFWKNNNPIYDGI